MIFRPVVKGALTQAVVVGFLIATTGILVPATADAETTSNPPPRGGYSALQPVGSWLSLPNDSQAESTVRRSTWEPRPENATANRTVPTGVNFATPRAGGHNSAWDSWLLPRVTGNFTGTTDEIIQWAAVKWGLQDDMLRAMAASESTWFQRLIDPYGNPVPQRGEGDYSTDPSQCPPGYTTAYSPQGCPLTFGIVGVKSSAHWDTFPHSRDSTAFNLDYVGAWLRGCYEGWVEWLRHVGYPYTAGDIWGCVGTWYSGAWYDSAANSYIASNKEKIANSIWLAESWMGQHYVFTQTHDVTPPTVLISSPTDQASVAGVTSVAVGAHDWAAVTKVELYVDGVLRAADTTSQTSDPANPYTASPYLFSWDSSTVANGEHTMTAQAYDTNGNTTTSLAGRVRVSNFTSGSVDTTAPTISIASGLAGSTIGNKTRISATAQDNVGVTGMELYVDGVRKTSSTGSSISYTWNSRHAAPGAHTITVKASDAASNTGQAHVVVYK